jgi:hypothetical protein
MATILSDTDSKYATLNWLEKTNQSIEKEQYLLQVLLDKEILRGIDTARVQQIFNSLHALSAEIDKIDNEIRMEL